MDFAQFLTAENASIAAIVMIVALFLKFMGKYSEKIDSIARECHQQSMLSQKLYQEQMKEIADDFMEVYKENTVALNKLRERIMDVMR